MVVKGSLTAEQLTNFIMCASERLVPCLAVHSI
jgi:hypothetical protein